jgi:hypothetical protein
MKRLMFDAILTLAVVFAMLLGCGRDFNRFPSGSTSSVTLTSVQPTEGSNEADIPIVLQGTNFMGNPRVLLGAVDCTSVVVVTDSLITATIPAGTAAGTYDVTLITEALEQASLASAFTVINPASVTVAAIDPNQGLDDVPVAVTITGTNFVTGATVSLGANQLEQASVVSATTIEATVQPGITPGVYDVIVANTSGGSATLVAGYTVLNSKELQITQITPNHGPTDEDTDVTIYGANFTDPMTVLIGSHVLDEVTVVAADMITTTVPAGIEPGVYTVRVINDSDEYAELVDGYTVDEAGTDDDDDTVDDDTSPADDDDDNDDDNNNDTASDDDDDDDNDDDDDDDDDNDNDDDDDNDNDDDTGADDDTYDDLLADDGR